MEGVPPTVVVPDTKLPHSFSFDNKVGRQGTEGHTRQARGKPHDLSYSPVLRANQLSSMRGSKIQELRFVPLEDWFLEPRPIA